MRCRRLLVPWAQVLLLPLCVPCTASPHDQIESVVEPIKKMIADPDAGWVLEWQCEYIIAVEGALSHYEDVADYDKRLDIVQRGFPTYWALLCQTKYSQLQFDVYKMEIEWFIETLMSEPLPSEADRQSLRSQLSTLCSWSGEHLRGQFPFLKDAMLEEAVVHVMSEFDEALEAPLLPIFRKPLSEDQLGAIKAQWARSHVRWSLIWRHAQKKIVDQMGQAGPPDLKSTAQCWFIHRCLRDLPSMMWFTVGEPPPDVVAAHQRLRKEKDAEARAQARARQWEMTLNTRMARHLEEMEQWSFVFGALLRTPVHPHKALRLRSPAGSTSRGVRPKP